MVARVLCFAGILSLCAFGLSRSYGAENANTWQKVYIKDGVEVFRKKLEGTPILGFAGEVMMSASPGKIMAIMSDIDNKPKWVDRMIENRVLEQLNPSTQVEYSHFSAPWPVSNREFVYRVQARYRPSGESTIDVRSIEHQGAPHAEGSVLGEILEARYILKSVTGTNTKVRVEVLMDPKGSLPTWLVNLVQESWPFKTLTALRDRVMIMPNPDPKTYERFLAH